MPLTIRADKAAMLDLPPSPTCLDALSDLPDASAFSSLLSTDEVETQQYAPPSAYARQMRCISKDAWHYGIPRLWSPEILTSSARTFHSEISERRFSETAPGSVEPISRFFKLHPHGVSNTLRAGTDAARGAFTSPRPIHYHYPRCITVREMARLHGFPDWFRFHKTKWHGARQIGNSVPPPLARAVASAVITAMGIAPQTVAPPIPLGDPTLLSREMSHAAAFWGIPCPLQKRDRKSGATKRTQSQTEADRLARSTA